jgi:hypothetical protein
LELAASSKIAFEELAVPVASRPIVSALFKLFVTELVHRFSNDWVLPGVRGRFDGFRDILWKAFRIAGYSPLLLTDSYTNVPFEN